MASSAWKTVTSSGVPVWIVAAAWLLLGGSGATIVSILLVALGGVGSLTLVASRPRLLRMLLVPRGLEQELTEATQRALQEQAEKDGKLVADTGRVAAEIEKQLKAYFEHTFEQIEAEFRAGRAPDLEHTWYLLIGTLASSAALLVLLSFLLTPLGAPLLVVLSGELQLVVFAAFVALIILCLFLASISRNRLRAQGILWFPLLLTSASYNDLASFARLAGTIQTRGDPQTLVSIRLTDLAAAREKGAAQRSALISAIAEQTSADPSLVTDVLTHYIASLVAAVVLVVFAAFFIEFYGRSMRAVGLVNVLVGAANALFGLYQGGTLFVVLGMGFLGTGLVFLFSSRKYTLKRQQPSS